MDKALKEQGRRMGKADVKRSADAEECFTEGQGDKFSEGGGCNIGLWD